MHYSLGVLLQRWVVHQVGELLGHLLPQLLKPLADLGEIGLLCKASCGGGGIVIYLAPVKRSCVLWDGNRCTVSQGEHKGCDEECQFHGCWVERTCRTHRFKMVVDFILQLIRSGCHKIISVNLVGKLRQKQNERLH